MSQFSRRIRLVPLAAAMSGALFLAACESAEEKAERYYQSGIALLEQGDTERALLELRNVFNHDGFHFEARKTYAEALMEKGDVNGAYSQYLRLIEQYPNTPDVRLTMAGIAIDRNDWDEAERHGKAAIDLDPENVDAKALAVTLAYRQATLDRKQLDRQKLAREAQEMLAQNRAAGLPDNTGLVRIVIDNLANGDNPAAALEAINTALEGNPKALDLNMGKIRILALLGDNAGTGEHLKKMVEIFPDNMEIRQGMIRWYLSQRDFDGAEEFLRDIAGDPTGPTEGHVNVVELLQNARGPAAARTELDLLRTLNAGTENGRFYTSMLASMDFAAGDTEGAIQTIRAALEGADPGQQTTRLETLLAEMLNNTGQQDQAREIVTKVLGEDTSNVAALKMRASWLIAEDKTGEAILALRTALNQSPRDTQTLTLMAMAHERDGDTDLVGERLSLAVEASDQAPAETVRYARFLMNQDRDLVAANVLEDSRAAHPNSPELLTMLAEVRLRTQDWDKAREIAQLLRETGNPADLERATELEFRILQGENRTEESLEIIQQMSSLQEGDDAAQKARAAVLTVQTQLRSGKADAARAYLDNAMRESPDNPDLQLLDISLKAISGQLAEAELGYRDLIERFPQSEVPVRLLISILMTSEREAEANLVLTEALERMPENLNLLWLKASLLESAGDTDGAIEVYEGLYSQASRSTVLANNLASLLATHRLDDESLERAATIARRLRGTNVPPFQDTYGWIAYRRGDMEEAVQYLEPAARALGNDALVQYHLGMTYAGLGRTAEARLQLNRALELAGDSTLPQFATARSMLETLSEE
jgi:tetratricopeptide (TPR) repeat protein